MLSKNTAEKLQLVQIINENINTTNSKNHENVDNIIEQYKDVVQDVGKLKEFKLTLHIDKSVSPVVQPSRTIHYNLRQNLLGNFIELEGNDIIEKVKVQRPGSLP